jgi:hypothetical protein
VPVFFTFARRRYDRTWGMRSNSSSKRTQNERCLFKMAW